MSLVVFGLLQAQMTAIVNIKQTAMTVGCLKVFIGFPPSISKLADPVALLFQKI